MSFLSGFVAILGPPNSGKSTLLNAFLGQKLAITSPKPQTTRNRILGIYNGDDFQMVFMDTPGIHPTRSLLHRSMVSSATASVQEVDIILLVVALEERAHREELESIIRLLKNTPKPVVLAINKIDLIKKENLLPIINSYSEHTSFDCIVPLSALHGDGMDILREELRKRLSPGPQLFPPDMVTDKSEAFLVAEIIREKIYLATRRELPYASAVVVESLEEDQTRNLFTIRAAICVEKPSQKGIIIGKQGRLLKVIGSAARAEMEKMFASKVYLELFVRVEKNWSSDTRALRKLGY